MTLLVALLTTANAWAMHGGSSLIDYENLGNDGFVTRQQNANPLTGGETMLNAGWYVVNGDISFTQPIQLLGDINIILADGCTMTMGTHQNRLGAFGFYGSAEANWLSPSGRRAKPSSLFT